MNDADKNELISDISSSSSPINKSIPTNSSNMIDFIILAEFDIDTGSTVRHIYPHDKSDELDRDWFANYMLPEGVHNRNQDWTYILLNRNSKYIHENHWTHPYNDFNDHNDSDKYLLYDLNLVMI